MDYGIITTYIILSLPVIRSPLPDFYSSLSLSLSLSPSFSQHCSYKTLFTKEVVPNDLRADSEQTHAHMRILRTRNRYTFAGEFIGKKKELVITAYCWLVD